MQSSIAEYLVHLARHGSGHSHHQNSKREAGRAMREFGLSDAQAEILMSGDSRRISAAVQCEFADTARTQALGGSRDMKSALARPKIEDPHAVTRPFDEPEADPRERRISSAR
jgi:hypothetical protein